MSEPTETTEKTEAGKGEPEEEYRFRYGKGGVPLWLTLVYVAFLTFLLFYVLDHLVPSWWSLVWHVDP